MNFWPYRVLYVYPEDLLFNVMWEGKLKLVFEKMEVVLEMLDGLGTNQRFLGIEVHA